MERRPGKLLEISIWKLGKLLGFFFFFPYFVNCLSIVCKYWRLQAKQRLIAAGLGADVFTGTHDLQYAPEMQLNIES